MLGKSPKPLKAWEGIRLRKRKWRMEWMNKKRINKTKRWLRMRKIKTDSSIIIRRG